MNLSSRTKEAAAAIACSLVVFCAGFAIGRTTAVRSDGVGTAHSISSSEEPRRDGHPAPPETGDALANRQRPEPDYHDGMYEYFGFPNEAGSTTWATEPVIESAIQKALRDFINVWRDPNPIRGWSASAEVAADALRKRLLFIKSYDYRSRIIARQIKGCLEDANLSENLRARLYLFLVEVRPRAEMTYFRRQVAITKDPWLRSKALSYLARNRDVGAMVAALKDALKTQEVEARADALWTVRGFFGEDVELDVPSEHWGALWTDGPPDDASLDALIQDVRAWWNKHHQQYENSRSSGASGIPGTATETERARTGA